MKQVSFSVVTKASIVERVTNALKSSIITAFGSQGSELFFDMTSTTCWTFTKLAGHDISHYYVINIRFRYSLSIMN